MGELAAGLDDHSQSAFGCDGLAAFRRFASSSPTT
jgi:hypothetical protein